MPHATEFQLHIFAALAQEERRLISERTKTALAQAKKRGIKLGKHGAVLANERRMRFEKTKASLRAIVPYWSIMSLSSIADYLNERKIRPIRGNRFYPATVKRYFGNYTNV